MVSLVPSLTEALASVNPEALVGATDWCTHPGNLVTTRVRGTKNPDCALIASLSPDIVIANKEENRLIDVDRLRAAGVQVWVTDIESVSDALTSMRRLFSECLHWPVPDWLDQAEQVWALPPVLPPLRTTVAIWRDPWMVVGRQTFTGDVLSRLGLQHVFAQHQERYPAVALAEIDDVDLVLLPDEPYAFSDSDGPEAFARARTCLVSGRLLTWYGPSMVQAREDLSLAIAGSM